MPVRYAPSEFERRWLPLGLALGTCSLVISALAITHFLLSDAQDAFAARLKQCARGFGAAAILCCLACHFVDPGSPSPDPLDPMPADGTDDAQRIRERRLPDGRAWKQKWCRGCRLWRPHRCGHCSVCERCTLRLDHHCGFMGTCIGERNMRFFAGFLLCSGLGIACLVVLAFRHLAQLGCWTDMSIWFQRWEPLAIVFLFTCCPYGPCMNMLVAAPGLIGGGAVFTLASLADTDMHSETSRFRRGKFTPGDARAELRAVLSCRGVRVYCLGPIALKLPCRGRRAAGDPVLHSLGHTHVGAVQSDSPELDEVEEQGLLAASSAAEVPGPLAERPLEP